MKIKLTSVMVDDQAKALAFYTEKLGFVTKQDIPMGEHRWLTVVSPGDPDGTELLLEPIGMEFAREFHVRLKEAGIPATVLFVDDLDSEYARLTSLGVAFPNAPMEMEGMPKMATLDDTCGNLIQVVQG